jgi:hypothetical protein
MTTPKTPLIRWLQFLGKVEFTTALLLGGVVIMTVGTILESRESREIAWSAVYGTAWFDIFLFLIGINLIIAVINRIPIQRHQWPFVLTHFAIVILLCGAWISRTAGFEGRMFIYEGNRENRIYLEGSEIQTRWTPQPGAASAGEVIASSFPLPKHGRLANEELKEEDERGPGIRIAEHVPDGVIEYGLREGGAGDPPGIEFLLSSGDQRLRQWLIADDPEFGRKDFGAVEIEFRRVGSNGVRGSHPDTGAAVHIAPRDGGRAIQIPLPVSLGEDLPIGPGLVARVREYFQRALVVGGKLTEAASGASNPAVIVEIRSENRSELYTIFGHYPDFGTVDGRDPERPLVATVHLELSPAPSKPRIAVLAGPGNELRLQLSGPSGASPPIPAALGRNELLAGFGLRLDRLIANASAASDVVPTPPGRVGSGEYVRLEIAANGTRQSMWVDHTGNFRGYRLNGNGMLEVAFGAQTRELPFSIALKEFELTAARSGSNRTRRTSQLTMQSSR